MEIFRLSQQDHEELFDLVDQIQQENRGAADILSKAEAAKDLQRAYAELGDNITPETLNLAVERFFEQRFSFKEPTPGWGLSAASAYLDRRKHGARAAVVAAAGVLIIAANGVYHRVGESSTEKDVEVMFNQRINLEERLEHLPQSPLFIKLPAQEQERFKVLVATGSDIVRGTNDFFNQYVNNGNAASAITSENYSEIRRQLSGIVSKLAGAEDDAKKAQGLLDTENSYLQLKANFDSNMLAVTKNQNAHPSLVNITTKLYASGINAIDSRNLAVAQENFKKFLATVEDIGQLAVLSSKPKALYDAISAVSKDNNATKKAQSLLERSVINVNGADVGRLTDSISELDNLLGELNSEYILRIVNRPGVDTGNWRYPLGDSSKPRSYYHQHPEHRNHYLIVEAIDGQGNPVPQKITNHETGKTEVVKMWGELVPYEIYQRTGKDKADNGHIDGSNSLRSNDADVLGWKKQGFVGVEANPLYQIQGKQITRWETVVR